MSWTTNCATSSIALASSRPRETNAPRTSDGGDGLAQNPGDLAIAADQRNFHAPGRDTDTAGADGSHLRAERVLHSKGDPALSTSTMTSSGGPLVEAGEGDVDCLFDLHVGPPGLRSFNGTPTSARTRGRATIGCRLSSSRLKGKSPLAMELIADRYRNG